MQTLPPLSKITINSITPTPSPSPSPHPHRLTFTVHSATHRFDSPNTTVASPNNVAANRTDWQSSCAILASKVLLQHQNSEKTDHVGNNSNNMTVVDERKAVDPPPVGRSRIPKPLTVSGGSPADRKLRVAYQGVRGNYSETAAGEAFPECETVACEHPDDAFQSVELSIADRAVLPVENSSCGSIHRTYDLLLRHRLHIVGELQLSFRHCLLALPGVRTEHINRVISHPQALAQCEQTLTKLTFNVRRESVADTARAAKFVREHNLRDTAVIASVHAAEIYNLNIIADGINDDSNNITRFITLAREPIIPTTDRPFKTSIVFAEERGTSVLFKVLSAFAFRNINLMKIESRPNRNRPVSVVDDEVAGTLKRFEYMFYVDFEASMADVRAQNAMAEVEEYTSFLRVLGSYPMDITPWRE